MFCRYLIAFLLVFPSSLVFSQELFEEDTFRGFEDFDGYNAFYYQILDKDRNVILHGKGTFDEGAILKPAKSPLVTPLKFKGSSTRGKVFFRCDKPGDHSNMDFLIYTGNIKEGAPYFHFAVEDTELRAAVMDSKYEQISQKKYHRAERIALKIEAPLIQAFQAKNTLVERINLTPHTHYYFSMVLLYNPAAQEPNVFYDRLKRQGEQILLK